MKNGQTIIVPNQLTTSDEILNWLQSNYGSANWNNWQLERQQFWSFVKYPTAGTANIIFFGDALGNNSVTLQRTNLPKNNSFGQVNFLVKSIELQLRINDQELSSFNGTDAETLASDIYGGFVQAGVLNFTIGSRNYSQIPLPFQYCASGMGQPKVRSTGLEALTLTEGTPNTFLSARTGPPYATLSSRTKGAYIMDPNVLIEADQNFSINIGYPSGAVPVIATGIVDDSTNPLYVGVLLDGLVFRPLQ